MGDGLSHRRIGGFVQQWSSEIQGSLYGLVVIGDHAEDARSHMLFSVTWRNGGVTGESIDDRKNFLGRHAVLEKTLIDSLSVADAGHGQLENQHYRTGHFEGGNAYSVKTARDIRQDGTVALGENPKDIGDTLGGDIRDLFYTLRSGQHSHV